MKPGMTSPLRLGSAVAAAAAVCIAGTAAVLRAQDAVKPDPEPAAPPPPPPPEKPVAAVPDLYAPARCVKVDVSGPLTRRLGTNLAARIIGQDVDILVAPFEKHLLRKDAVGTFIGTWMDAAVRALAYTEDPRLRARLDRTARKLVASQEPAGYLGTYVASWEGHTANRFLQWDLWQHRFTLLGLLAYAEACDDEASLEAATKLANYIVRHIKHISLHAFARFGEGHGKASTSLLEPMMQLYRITGRTSYLDLGPGLIHDHVMQDLRQGVFGRRDMLMRLVNYLAVLEYGRMAKPGHVEALSKAVSAKLEAGDHYPTGAISLRNLGVAGDLSTVFVTRQRTTPVWLGKSGSNQGCMKDGSEGCNTAYWMELNYRLFRLTGKLPFIEEVERVVYNQLPAHQAPSTGGFDDFVSPHGVRDYAPPANCSCCAFSLARAMAMVPEMAAGTLDGGPAVMLYLPGVYRLRAGGGLDVDLAVETDLPASGKVVIRVTPAAGPATFGVTLRVPSWTDRFTARAGGTGHEGKPGELLVIKRAWARGDTIDIDMAMTAAPVPFAGKPSLGKLTGIRRGPQILAVDAMTAGEAPLPAEWVGTQKYRVNVRREGADTVLFMVPFADAGQRGGGVSVFLPGIEAVTGATSL
jgi:hypothetical protein